MDQMEALFFCGVWCTALRDHVTLSISASFSLVNFCTFSSDSFSCLFGPALGLQCAALQAANCPARGLEGTGVPLGVGPAQQAVVWPRASVGMELCGLMKGASSKQPPQGCP